MPKHLTQEEKQEAKSMKKVYYYLWKEIWSNRNLTCSEKKLLFGLFRYHGTPLFIDLIVKHKEHFDKLVVKGYVEVDQVSAEGVVHDLNYYHVRTKPVCFTTYNLKPST